MTTSDSLTRLIFQVKKLSVCHQTCTITVKEYKDIKNSHSYTRARKELQLKSAAVIWCDPCVITKILLLLLHFTSQNTLILNLSVSLSLSKTMLCTTVVQI